MLFVGALTTLIAFGRTLGPAADDTDGEVAGAEATRSAGRREPVEPVRADADDEPADADGSEQPGEPGRTAESNEPVNW